MKTVVIVISLVILIWMIFIASFYGLDIKKRSSWWYGAISFLCGLVLGLVIASNLIEGLKIGVAFAFLTLFTGTNTRRHKLETKKMTESLLLQYKNEELPPLIAYLVKKLLEIPFIKKIFEKYK